MSGAVALMDKYTLILRLFLTFHVWMTPTDDKKSACGSFPVS